MNENLKNFRELVWPLLEKESDNNIAVENTEEQSEKPGEEYIVKIEEDNLDLALQLQTKIYQEEEERRKGTESKAALFMGALSVANTIIIGANTMIWGKDIPGVVIKTFVIISILLAVYSIRTVWFSVKVLERGAFHVLGNSEVNMAGDKNEYRKEIIRKFMILIKNNEKLINMKVTNLAMAQAYYKRAMFVICMYAFMVFYFCFFY